MKVALGSDHGGYEIKEAIRHSLERRGIEVEDVGTHGLDSVDYPDYAREVAMRVSQGAVDQGVLVCTTGVGMAITANRFPGVRAALCSSPEVAALSRTHNDANVLALGGKFTTPAQAEAILDAWLGNAFNSAERHARRLNKLDAYSRDILDTYAVMQEDLEVLDAIRRETRRQQETLNLIASENYASRAVRQAQGCLMTNKYAEGYPGKRWYQGCEFVDEVERLAIDRARRMFGAEHANVQPHCGSSANMAVYFAALRPGDTILAMSLAHGGHLTHGHRANFSGRFFNVVPYGVSRDTETIDYDEVARLAQSSRPRLIVAGASAYPRVIDFERLRRIADAAGAQLMVDMAHIAGLVAAGCHPNPVPLAEFVTTTTHKSLRGPRGGMILCRESLASDIDRQVFPGIQGGPFMHTIAAKAVCFLEAMSPSFRAYGRQVVANARRLSEVLAAGGLRLVSGGTDNHLMLADVTGLKLTGAEAATALATVGISVNKNVIPFDEQAPAVTSGIRIGTLAVTTRGMKESEMDAIGECILDVLRHVGGESRLQEIKGRVLGLTSRFPSPA